MTILFRVVQLCFAIALLILSLDWRSPFLASIRNEVFWVAAIVSVVLIGLGIIQLKKGDLVLKILNYLSLAIAVVGCLLFFTTEAKFYANKRAILNGNPTQLESIGQHFIIGYKNLDEVKKLVKTQAIGGIFLTTHNIKGKTAAEIKQEIQTLQTLRQEQRLSPLWIATDQEGGVVSRLSPPLTQLPQLSKIIAEKSDRAARKKATINYAKTQGQGLSDLGINLNFAPVVDLNKNIVNPDDKYSKIYQRAISTDKKVVAQVAKWYCQTLEEYGVQCTLKHFPGLGRVENDTHLSSAELNVPVAELEGDDWVPFRKVMQQTNAFTMLGHAILTDVDRDRAVSFSKAAISDIIRQQWQHDGVLITDDFCMYAVYGSKKGLEGATVAALNAGVDLILIAYDSDLYYPAMQAALNAAREGKLDRALLQKSQARLEQAKKT
ncbi:glycoside hydrolase family 3 N-terminal domain-containing protein [Lusitaniella coriacea]|uniref:glycoside hydrolase family 3 N-terminal domain-containing protein n=1 Tax=Lusitaniella coriacea TaxID=1983105 RepID=UPI003CF7C785